MPSSNCIRCMMNEQASKAPASGGGFNPASYGTPLGYWVADDANWSGTTVPGGSKIASRFAGGVDMLPMGTPDCEATGWKGTSKAIYLAQNTFRSVYAGGIAGQASPIMFGVWDVGVLNGLQVIQSWSGSNDLHQWVSLYGAACNAEVSGAGSTTGSPVATTGKHVYAMQQVGQVYTVYVDGVLVLTWNSATTNGTGNRTRFDWGNKPATNAYSAGSRFKAGALFSAISSSVAAISTALTAQFIT